MLFFKRFYKFSFVLLTGYCFTFGETLRIIGGRDALRDEFPYAVGLEIRIKPISDTDHDINYQRFCSGAAVTSEWIISAAHCYYFLGYENIERKCFIRYNSYLPHYMGQLNPVLEVFMHPRFLPFELKRMHDVALFQSKNISVSQYAKISAVDYRTLLGHEVNILGFGRNNASYNLKPLQVLKGMINKCLKDDLSGASHFCVVTPCGLKATICGGDSGGPVVHSSGIVGVNSQSVDDCNEFTTSLHITPGTSASVVATVSDITDWIINVISKKAQKQH